MLMNEDELEAALREAVSEVIATIAAHCGPIEQELERLPRAEAAALRERGNLVLIESIEQFTRLMQPAAGSIH